MHEWGGNPTYWMELNEGGDAERQLEFYPNGNQVSYDASHQEDEHGGLSVMVIDGDADWWTPHFITKDEFEAAWAAQRPLNREFRP